MQKEEREAEFHAEFLVNALGKIEWDAFVGADRFNQLAEQVDSVVQVSEIVEALAPVRVQSAWALTKPALKGLEDMLRKTREAIAALQERLADLELSIDCVDVPALSTLERLLRKILRAFVEYTMEPDVLLQRLNAWLLEVMMTLMEAMVPIFHTCLATSLSSTGY